MGIVTGHPMCRGSIPSTVISAPFESIGFTRCDTFDLEAEFEKVAIFANETGPTHASKQLSDGRWSSKLGVFEDIEHELEALTGDEREEYGKVVQILKRTDLLIRKDDDPRRDVTDSTSP